VLAQHFSQAAHDLQDSMRESVFGASAKHPGRHHTVFYAIALDDTVASLLGSAIDTEYPHPLSCIRPN
jgi:hypothetical protein